MPDMLVNLLKLPSLDRLNDEGINIRRAQPFGITPVRRFIERDFSVAWADEISVGFANKPVTVVIATRDGRVIGFAGYECTRKAFFGPTGVAPDERGRGIGTALLIASLWGLRELGYVYGIIGGAGPTDFYERAVGAIVIPESEPGILYGPFEVSRAGDIFNAEGAEDLAKERRVLGALCGTLCVPLR